MRWKGSVDEVATFLDGGKLPCLLVENKADLLEEENAEKNPELEVMDFVDLLELRLKLV